MCAFDGVPKQAHPGQAEKESLLPDLLPPKSILVVGLGNPILGDDGAGWAIAEEVRHLLQTQSRQDVTVELLSLGGLSLMEQLIGFDRVILIDSISSPDDPPGEIRCARLEDIEDPTEGHTASIHDTTLQNAIQTGRLLGAHLPEDILVIGITTNPCYDFKEGLSPTVAAAVPRAAQSVIDTLTMNGSQHPKESIDP